MPGISGIATPFVELDFVPLAVRLKGKNVPTYASSSCCKNKAGKAGEAETLTNRLLIVSNYSLAAIIPQQNATVLPTNSR